jgi:methylated-DNA-protein-cysteine methyltransferase-like protein
MTTSVEINEIIWQVVNSIPKGKVATYGQVAAIAGYPQHARLVGNVLKKLPKDTSLPWHRVINAQGKISFPVDSEAYKRQRSLLEQEGIKFLNGKLSLKQYGWQG